MRKRPRPDQIAAILRDFQADLDAGLNIGQACRKAGIGPTTYYRWKALQENPLSNEQLREEVPGVRSRFSFWFSKDPGTDDHLHLSGSKIRCGR